MLAIPYSERKNMNGCNEVLEAAGVLSAIPNRSMSRADAAPIRIWMVDDNAGFRALLANILNEEGGLECARQFSSPVGVLEALKREAAPDIILLDVEMGEYNGLDAIRPIKLLAPDTHVLMLTTFAGPGGRERAFREGASDFMLKTWPVTEIVFHIHQAKELGSVAGLLTTFLSKGKPVELATMVKQTREVEVVEKSSVAERWVAYLRGLLKFSPS
jgi:DNA-binding NarL/FixJ family response regulator